MGWNCFWFTFIFLTIPKHTCVFYCLDCEKCPKVDFALVLCTDQQCCTKASNRIDPIACSVLRFLTCCTLRLLTLVHFLWCKGYENVKIKKKRYLVKIGIQNRKAFSFKTIFKNVFKNILISLCICLSSYKPLPLTNIARNNIMALLAVIRQSCFFFASGYLRT